MEEPTQFYYDKLRRAVEKTVCCKIATPKDFTFLAMKLKNVTGTRLSPTTLKRFFGYIPNESNTTPRDFTLDTLSLFVGYKDFEHFCHSSGNETENVSDFLNNKTIYTKQLAKGDRLRLLWLPNRCITVELLGQDMFEVVESANSKLQVGDTFHCSHFTENESLVLHSLHRKGLPPTNYVCGRNNGVKLQVIAGALGGGVANNLNINTLAIYGDFRINTDKHATTRTLYREVHTGGQLRRNITLFYCANRWQAVLHETTETGRTGQRTAPLIVP